MWNENREKKGIIKVRFNLDTIQHMKCFLIGVLFFYIYFFEVTFHLQLYFVKLLF